MRPLAALLVAALFALVAHAGDASAPASEALIRRYEIDKPFADVVFELEFAITERNFRITGRNAIGQGLRDRGYEDFPDVEVIHFCSLELAREVLLLDPGYVAHMPCRITVHVAAERTVVSLITLPLDHPDARVNAFARRMNSTLQEIVDYALAP
jgi:uncharacterized protein (DUF302 family)